MNVTARYVDTCLSDYLQDSYSREGQTLLLCSLGCDLATTVESLVDSMDGDCGLPESVSDGDVARAVRSALEGVDLRYIDEDGTRQDEPAEDRDHDEPYLYVVVEWDATTVKVQLTVDVEFYLCDEDPLSLTDTAEKAIWAAMGRGDFTSGLDSMVKSWGATASLPADNLGERCKPDVDIRNLIESIDRFHGNELKDRSENSIIEEIATIKGLLGA